MLVAKLTAFVGLVLLVGGATHALGSNSLAISAVLLLVASAIAAVVLEGRELELVAGLAADGTDELDATVADPPFKVPMLDEQVRPAA